MWFFVVARFSRNFGDFFQSGLVGNITTCEKQINYLSVKKRAAPQRNEYDITVNTFVKCKMKEYWESKFKTEGPIWDFFPADSAIEAVELFKANNLKKILIPGFGYGRNGKLFINNNFNVTGIEISESAIGLARSHNIKCTIHPGSVTEMPFDNEIFDGIYCYALIHLLNKNERKAFLNSCFKQLKIGGLMIFLVAAINSSMFDTGKRISKNRFKIPNGLNVFYYDSLSINKEFSPYGMIDYKEMEEPIKFMENQPPVKLISVTCKKNHPDL